MADVRTLLTSRLAAVLTHMGASDVPADVVRSPRLDIGDWSCAAPLRAAKVLRRAPMDIANEMVAQLAPDPDAGIARWEATPPGYVNAHLSPAWAHQVIDEALGLKGEVPVRTASDEDPDGTTLIEHTNINTNKAAHVGHLRNACLGDSLSRILRRRGERVEVNNYIDDTGVQVADVVIGIAELGLEPHEGEPYDHYCSRVYVEVKAAQEKRPELIEKRKQLLLDVERRDSTAATTVKALARRIVHAHLATMARFGITYDLLTWESDILERGFWTRAFELLREAGIIEMCPDGVHANCWVLPGEDGDLNSDQAKVLVKSDGLATYTAKDIAYQLWKFGLLDRDFFFEPWAEGSSIMTTSSDPGNATKGVSFGRATTVVNVIDARQAYPQAVVREALRRLGHDTEAQHSHHLAYEVVALAPSAAAALGVDISDGKGSYAMSGRKGIDVRADDLLDAAIAKLAPRARDARAVPTLAAAAVRHYLQKFTLTTIIAFDFDEALRVSGDSGVYLLYTHARAAGILRKLGDVPSQGVFDQEEPVERELLHAIDGYRYALRDAAEAMSPAILSTYVYALASAFVDFYERTDPLVREEDLVIRDRRHRLVAAARATLADGLRTLGMEPLDSV